MKYSIQTNKFFKKMHNLDEDIAFNITHLKYSELSETLYKKIYLCHILFSRIITDNEFHLIYDALEEAIKTIKSSEDENPLLNVVFDFEKQIKFSAGIDRIKEFYNNQLRLERLYHVKFHNMIGIFVKEDMPIREAINNSLKVLIKDENTRLYVAADYDDALLYIH